VKCAVRSEEKAILPSTKTESSYSVDSKISSVQPCTHSESEKQKIIIIIIIMNLWGTVVKALYYESNNCRLGLYTDV
jgi:hypothetical protein